MSRSWRSVVTERKENVVRADFRTHGGSQYTLRINLEDRGADQQRNIDRHMTRLLFSSDWVKQSCWPYPNSLCSRVVPLNWPQGDLKITSKLAEQSIRRICRQLHIPQDTIRVRSFYASLQIEMPGDVYARKQRAIKEVLNQANALESVTATR